MGSKNTRNGLMNFLALQKQGIPHTEFRLGQTSFRLSDGSNDDGGNPPACRDDAWRDMLRMVMGYVPEGAEDAPPCHCELRPIGEKCNFAGLAGLPPTVRLMDGFFPVRDQSKRGACFAFALVALCEYMLGKTVELSEQSVFHFTKLITPGKVEDLDDGAIILDSIHAVEEYGICPLSEWHYNPESWNYVEDPYNEGQGKALQRKLEAAQPYRFRNWRTLSRGSVLQFKQALSAGFPIYTGALVTTDWDDQDVRRTGAIPYPKLFWRIRVLPPPRGLVEAIMTENGVDPSAEGVDEIAGQIASKLIYDTIEYVGAAVFGCRLIVCDSKEGADSVELIVRLDRIRGGHALCLAGYVDDDSYPGGGYFIARNSWSDSKWAPESPEMPGYALLPYAYVTDLGLEGNVMSEFPNRMVRDGIGIQSGGDRGLVGVTSGRIVGPDFETWFALRKSVLSRPMRDADGVMLRPGESILVPDPGKHSGILRDTPQNRAKLRGLYEGQLQEASAAAEKERQMQETAIAEARLIRFETVLRETIDRAFAADEYAVISLAMLKAEMLSRDPDLAVIPEIDSRIRASVLALQKGDKRKYWFVRGFNGVEEIRPSGKDPDRITV